MKLPKDKGDTPTLHLCRLCGKVVRNKWHHYRYHNPEYFKCSLCHTVHNRKDHLKAHMKIKHSIDSFSSSQGQD
ncbi:Sex determination protein fruitless [Zootermopsis nevadensis]|uniref:Sex determination protein fruitless n=2 Tax=Zootermopsis nevadensis TaxID=136037 RepID=A0A067REV0_ZOONE|nr:Sex determination protein fruitless [Zootermopsis nevadensis]